MISPVSAEDIARSYAELALYIDGRWQAPLDGASYDLINPADEEIFAEAPQAGAADAELAIEAAARAFRSWRHIPASDRAEMLRRIGAKLRGAKALIATHITLEMGKPFAQALGEVESSAALFDWFAEEAPRAIGQLLPPRGPGGASLVSWEPLGVVAAFSPWNFPVSMLARKIATALAAGCTVIARPAEQAPGAAAAMLRCIEAAGVPPGVVNLLLGHPEPAASVLLAAPQVRKVSFTGSVAVGKLLYAASAPTLKKLSLELGGHAPVIVFDKVRAAGLGRMAAQRKFANAGQVCVSPTRFYVQEDALDPFAEAFTATAKALRIGPGLDPATEVGPLATPRARDRIESMVDQARAEGARILTGGARPDHLNRGYFFQPTVVTEVSDRARLMQEEIFGPVAPITPFRTEAEVIDRANSSPVGLAGYVFTPDLNQAHRLMRDLELGMIGVNTLVLGRREAPFGGTKYSGIGREGGTGGIYEYMEQKWCEIAYEPGETG